LSRQLDVVLRQVRMANTNRMTATPAGGRKSAGQVNVIKVSFSKEGTEALGRHVALDPSSE
jgi:hypothetical protein